MGAASSFNALDADTYYTKTQVQSLFQENGIPSIDFTETFEENAEADGSISGATLRYLVQTQEQNHQQLGPPPQKNKQPSLVQDLSWYGRDDAVDKKQADSAIPGLQPGCATSLPYVCYFLLGIFIFVHIFFDLNVFL